MPISKKQRFTIFDRDGFACQYCGEMPPNVLLHVDHIISKKDGGGDEEENLLTACRDCNLGKSAKSVKKSKLKKTSWKGDTEKIRDKKEQLEAYYEYVKAKDEMEYEELNIFQKRWEDCSGYGDSLTETGMCDMQKLTKKYSTDTILEAIKITWNTTYVEPEKKFQYMCGVLKSIKLTQDNPEKAEEIKLKNKIRGYVRRHFYMNEGYMNKLLSDINHQESLEVAKEMGNMKNWTQFRDYCDSNFYPTTDA